MHDHVVCNGGREWRRRVPRKRGCWAACRPTFRASSGTRIQGLPVIEATSPDLHVVAAGSGEADPDPGTPTETPTPDFEKLNRKGPAFRLFRT
jgi:hypothetical protein